MRKGEMNSASSSNFRIFSRRRKEPSSSSSREDISSFRITNPLSTSSSCLLENSAAVASRPHSLFFDSRQSSVESSTSTASTASSSDLSPFDTATLSASLSSASSAGSLHRACSSSTGSSSPTGGPRFKLLHEGDIQVCRIDHSRTVINKIMSSKFLRRWENHHLILTASDITSRTPTGFMEQSVPYSLVEEVHVVLRWDSNHKSCIRIVIPDGSLLLQVNNTYVRDQWLHSILWKRNIWKCGKLIEKSTRPEVLLRELKGLTELALTTPLQDDCIYQLPLDMISTLLPENLACISKSQREEICCILSPLLETTTPTAEICDFFCKYCQENPRSTVVLDVITPIVQRILRHNVDFGKYPKSRALVQAYVEALSYQNDGRGALQKFVSGVHGVSSTCPHPRVLPNLVSTCLAAIYALYEEKKSTRTEDLNDNILLSTTDWESRLTCFLNIIEILSTYEDWRPALAQLLQPMPFPDNALADGLFTSRFKVVLSEISNDVRCEVHLSVLGVRSEKEGWLPLYCPGNIACDDDGELWSNMLKRLLSCCCRRKSFLESLQKSLGACMLRALRGDETLQLALCSMLELDVIADKDLQLQLITTLQSTPSGKKYYASLCQRQQHLRQLQQKGGPRKLTLPSRSTDDDVAKLLSCGSFGNLECLSLAFTQVTSACAEHLIKLPSLKYLNLWSTQFGDQGLQLLSEHLKKLQVLNLCETSVTDKGIRCLTAIKSLRKLNLNSTGLTAQTFEKLKQKLPALQECDVRYTDAW